MFCVASHKKSYLKKVHQVMTEIETNYVIKNVGREGQFLTP